MHRNSSVKLNQSYLFKEEIENQRENREREMMQSSGSNSGMRKGENKWKIHFLV